MRVCVEKGIEESVLRCGKEKMSISGVGIVEHRWVVKERRGRWLRGELIDALVFVFVSAFVAATIAGKMRKVDQCP